MRGPLWILVVCGAWISAAALAAQTSQPSTPPRQLATACRIEGHVSSGQTPLPGVSVLVQEDRLTKTETSTGVDGAYAIALGPGAVYHCHHGNGVVDHTIVDWRPFSSFSEEVRPRAGFRALLTMRGCIRGGHPSGRPRKQKP